MHKRHWWSRQSDRRRLPATKARLPGDRALHLQRRDGASKPRRAYGRELVRWRQILMTGVPGARLDPDSRVGNPTQPGKNAPDSTLTPSTVGKQRIDKCQLSGRVEQGRVLVQESPWYRLQPATHV